MRVRSTLLLLAVAASTALLASPAAAEESATISLDGPAEIYFGLHSSENYGGPRPVVSPYRVQQPWSRVPVGWGGTVTIAVPPQLDLSGTFIELGVFGEADNSMAPPLRYSTRPSGTDKPLTVTTQPGNRLQVRLPANDGVNGPFGMLHISGLRAAGGSVPEGERSSYGFVFSAGGPSTVNVAPQLVMFGDFPTSGGSRQVPLSTVAAGSSFDLALPASSRLTGLGIDDLRTAAFSLRSIDGEHQFTGEPVPLTARVAADGRTASLTVPAGTAVGGYGFAAIIGDGAGAVWAQIEARVEVTPAVAVPAAPTAAEPTPAAPTEVAEEPVPAEEPAGETVTATAPVTAASASPLYLLGAGALVVAAGVVGAVLVQRRRAAAPEEPPAPPAEELVGAGTP
jgi:hypothetical protein